VAAFHADCPLQEAEVDVGWQLVCAAQRSTLSRAGAGGVVPAPTAGGGAPWRSPDHFAGIHPRLARYRLRDACGLPAHCAGERIREYLATCSVAPLLAGMAGTTVFGVDLSAGSTTVRPADAGAAPARFDALIRSVVEGDTWAVGVGGYGEDRLIYTTAAFAGGDPAGDVGAERRTVHLGIDVWTHPGREVFAPLAGTVVVAHDNAARLDYGPVVVLEHRTDADTAFYTLYGHLARRTLDHVRVGAALAAGELLGWVGAPPSNGDWAPHVHVQVVLDLLDLGQDYPGVCRASQRSAWLALSPDPQLLVRLSPPGRPAPG